MFRDPDCKLFDGLVIPLKEDSETEKPNIEAEIKQQQYVWLADSCNHLQQLRMLQADQVRLTLRDGYETEIFYSLLLVSQTTFCSG